MSKSEEIKVLKETIASFKKQIEPHDCGWMHTTIDGLKHRIKVLRKEIKQMKPKGSWKEGYIKWKNERCPHN